MQLRDYQLKGVNNTATKLANGKRKCAVQLPTGGGKTIMFSAIAQRYVSKSGKRVLILVDRKELMRQTQVTLYNAYGISAQVIKAGMKHIPDADVYVGMVESVNRRIKMLENIGLVIIDEAHTASFNKLHQHFPTQFILGFTATPKSSNKRFPMKLFYDDIVVCAQIGELIRDGHLCQNITYSPKEHVDRANLTIKNGEFDDDVMAVEFSKPKYIHSTVEAYKKHGTGKAIIFNINRAHNIAVCEAFITAGYNAKAVDSTMTERDDIFKWYKNTPDAILCNVGIATKGYDEPSIETVCVNKATKSMPNWLQMTGRGSRPTHSKSMFIIIDMGGNALEHGDWCADRNWEDIFYNPVKADEALGVAPLKVCPQCEAMIAAGKLVCEFCGYVYPEKQILEEQLGELVVVTKNIDVDAIIERGKMYKEYYPFYKIGEELAIHAKKTLVKLNDDSANFILNIYHELARAWCKKASEGREKRIGYSKWHQERAKTHLFNELHKHFPLWQEQKLVSTAA